MCPQSGRLLSLMNPTGNLNNESFHYANGKMRIQRLCPEELHLKMDGNRRRGDRSNAVIPDPPRAKEVCTTGFEFY
jgi:hypothetical protein